MTDGPHTATVSPVWADELNCSYGRRAWRIHSLKTVWGGPTGRGIVPQVLTEH